MKKVLVLGYGNPLRGDDGVGWIAASTLNNQIDNSQVIIETCHQLTPELAEQFSEVDILILVDADAQGTPGEVKVRQVTPSDPFHEPINHFSKPETILSMAKELYGKVPKAYIASITGVTFELSESLSPTIEQSLPNLIDRIQTIIDDEIYE